MKSRGEWLSKAERQDYEKLRVKNMKSREEDYEKQRGKIMKSRWERQ